MNIPRTTLPAAVLAGLLALTGCGGGGEHASTGSGDHAAAPSTSRSVSPDTPFNAADITFAEGMKPHHESAVDMADLILVKDPRREIRELAGEIKAAQEPEIAQLERMLQTFGAGAPGAGAHGGGHGAGAAGSSVDGMSEEDMAELESASGAHAEELFLEMMLEHHRGAVEMADTEIAEGEYREAVALARTIKTDQEREIREMEQLLQQV